MRHKRRAPQSQESERPGKKLRSVPRREPTLASELVHSKATTQKLRTALEECKNADTLKVLVIKGTSGSGKTLATSLICDELNVEVVTMDIMQLHKDMTLEARNAGREPQRFRFVVVRAHFVASNRLRGCTGRFGLQLKGLGECCNLRYLKDEMAIGLDMISAGRIAFAVVILGKTGQSQLVKAIERKLGRDRVLSINFPEPTLNMVTKAAKFSFNCPVDKALVERAILEVGSADLRHVMDWLSTRITPVKPSTTENLTKDNQNHPSHVVGKFVRARKVAYESLLREGRISRDEFDSLQALHRRCRDVKEAAAAEHARRSERLRFLSAASAVEHGNRQSGIDWNVGYYLWRMNLLDLKDYYDHLIEDLNKPHPGPSKSAAKRESLTSGLLDIESPVDAGVLTSEANERLNIESPVRAAVPTLQADLEELDPESVSEVSELEMPLSPVKAASAAVCPESLLGYLQSPLQSVNLIELGDRKRLKELTNRVASADSLNTCLRCTQDCVWENVPEVFRMIPDHLYATVVDLFFTHIPELYDSLSDIAGLYWAMCSIDRLFKETWNADLPVRASILTVGGQLFLTEPKFPVKRKFAKLNNAFTATRTKLPSPDFLSQHKFAADMDFET